MKRKILLILIYLITFVCILNAQSLIFIKTSNDGANFLFLNEVDLTEFYTKFNPNVDTVIFIHGFNTPPDKAKSVFTDTVKKLSPYLGNINYIGFYWPSDTGLLSFGRAIENADKTNEYLIYILNKIASVYAGTKHKIHFITHSLGGRVILNTLKQNESRYIPWGHCFNMAAAVHYDVYFNTYKDTNLPPEKTLVYYSHNDWVLKYFYSLYYWLFGEGKGSYGAKLIKQWLKNLTIEEIIKYLHKIETKFYKERWSPTQELDKILLKIMRESKKAMGLDGALLGNPVVIEKVTNINCSDIVDGHKYWQSNEVLTKIGLELKKHLNK